MKKMFSIFLKYFLLLLLSLLNFSSNYYIKQGKQNKEISNFAFGSCFKGYSERRDDIFKFILKKKPEMFAWLGDVTYLDSISDSIISHFFDYNSFNEQNAIESYNESFNNKDYIPFREVTPIIGVWDDHDFGHNNASGNFKQKDFVKKLFLDFVEEPAESERRKSMNGIYTSYSYGTGFKTNKIILLDVRYNKSLPNEKERDILGEEQWKWLEKELVESDETFTFICSGFTILSFNRIIPEGWYDESRKRLFNLIGKTKKSGVILLSGDLHFAEVCKTFCVHPSKYFTSHFNFNIKKLVIIYMNLFLQD